MPRIRPWPIGRGRTARHAQPGLVVLTAGWSGERVLIRLLSAGGSVRIVGHALARKTADPARRLREVLRPTSGRVTGAVVLPHHLWLVNDVEAGPFVESLVADGVVVVALTRRSSEDRGLSVALCGPMSEVLPSNPRHVDAGDVALHAHESEAAAEWFDALQPFLSARFVFEDDLMSAADRQKCADRMANGLGLVRWDAPPETEVPDSSSLWRLVANADAVRDQLTGLRTIPHG